MKKICERMQVAPITIYKWVRDYHFPMYRRNMKGLYKLKYSYYMWVTNDAMILKWEMSKAAIDREDLLMGRKRNGLLPEDDAGADESVGVPDLDSEVTK